MPRGRALEGWLNTSRYRKNWQGNSIQKEQHGKIHRNRKTKDFENHQTIPNILKGFWPWESGPINRTLIADILGIHGPSKSSLHKDHWWFKACWNSSDIYLRTAISKSTRKNIIQNRLLLKILSADDKVSGFKKVLKIHVINYYFKQHLETLRRL